MIRMSGAFSVTYDGPAMAANSMDVRDLAPALLGMADAVERAQQLVAPGPPVRLEIDATNPGSFDVALILRELSEFYEHTVNLFMSDDAQAFERAALIVQAVGGAIALAVTKHRQKSVATIKDAPDGDVPTDSTVKITFADGSVVETTGAAWAVYNDGKAMVGLRKAVKPLEEGTIESLTFKAESVDPITVEVADKPAFEAESDTQPLDDNTIIQALQPVDITFRDNGKWKVNDGTATFYATVEDEDFMARVDAGTERFGKTDIIRARVRTTQVTVDGVLRAEKAIVEVLEHRPGGTQGELDI